MASKEETSGFPTAHLPTSGQVRSVCGQRSDYSHGPLLFTDETYPRDNELPTKVLHLGLDFATDVELMAVEGDALQVGQQVLLAGRVWTLTGE